MTNEAQRKEWREAKRRERAWKMREHVCLFAGCALYLEYDRARHRWPRYCPGHSTRKGRGERKKGK